MKHACLQEHLNVSETLRSPENKFWLWRCRKFVHIEGWPLTFHTSERAAFRKKGFIETKPQGLQVLME